MLKKALRILLIILLILVVLIGGFFIAIRYPTVQTYLAQRATAILSNTLETKVSIDRVEISFFNKADLVNFYMEDHEHDTMICVKDLNIKFKVFDLFSKKVNVSSISLDGGVLYLHRDSTGLRSNLSDVFKKFQSNKATADTSAAKVAWDINLQQFGITGTHLRYKDDKSHLDLNIGIPSCQVALNTLDIKKGIIAIKSAKIDKVDVFVELMKRTKGPEDSTGPFHFLLGGPKITFDEFALTNSHFRLQDNNSDTVFKKGMDFKHLDLTDINLLADDDAVIGDTIFANIKTLSAKERCGFVLQNLTSVARISTSDVTLDKLSIITPNSEIKNFLSFKYNSFSDFKDFLNTVRIKAKFDKTKFALKDLNYFLRKLDKVEHNSLLINGELDGRINNLKGRGIDISTGTSTVFKGDFYTRGLPNIYETSLNLRVNRLATNVNDIKRIYPSLVLPENLNSLGLIYYTGSVDGFLTDFVSNGKLVTSLGTATTDVNFKYDKKNNKAYYNGDLALNDFDIGKFLKDENNFGKVSLVTKINGGGLTPESLHAELDGNITSIVLRGYDYKDIKVNGSVLKKSFNGLLKIQDQYLDMDFNGKADLSQKTPELNFDATVRKAMLKYLNLTTTDFSVAGSIHANFKGSKLDDAIGSLKVDNLVLTRDTIVARLNHATLDAKMLEGQKKSITLNSDIADAEMTGNFTIKQLPKALLSFANYTFTKDYVDTAAEKVQQDFSLDVVIYQTGNLPQIFVPKLKIGDKARITCDFNTIDKKLNLTANIPEVAIGNIDIRRTNIITTSTNGKFDFRTTADRVYNGDSILLDSVVVASKTIGEDIRFDVSASDKKKFNYADITAFLTPQKGQAILRFDSSEVKLGNNIWHFDPNNYVFIKGKKIVTNNLAFKTNDQKIYINSFLKNDSSTSVRVTLDNTSISDFMGSFMAKSKEVSGVVNGTFVAEDLFYKPHVYADLVVEEFKLGNELIGDINIDSRLDSSGEKILLYASVKSSNPNPEYRNYIEADGVISLGKKPTMRIDIVAQKLGLNFLNYKFFNRYVSNCRGYATVNATLAGPLNKPLLTGKVLLVHDTVTVPFLNTTYHIDNQTALLDEHGFNVDGIMIRDVKNSPCYGSGRIDHESFKNFTFGINVVTDNAQFLNTTAKDNPNFYGVAYGQGNVQFLGPVSNLKINAYAVTKAGTYCKLPINSSFETNRYSFYKFTGHGKDTVTNNKPVQLKLNGVTFTLNVKVTPEARMDIILDPVSGDLLTAYGSSDNLNIYLPKDGNIAIRGEYTIERGNYLFTLQNIINKRFDINPGGTISFAGDAYKARLNVDAVYEVRTSVSDLIDQLINNGAPVNTSTNTTPNQLTSAALARIPIKLLMNLTGVLEHPNISFDIKAVDPDPSIKSYVDQQLALLKNNESEMNKQVVGLLVMNRFLPTSSSTSSAITNGSNLSGTAANTVSEFISSQLSNYLSNLLEFANIRNLDVNIGYRQYDQLTGGGTSTQSALDTRRELQLALTQRLLNNRLSINAGGNLDFGTSVVYDAQGAPVTSSGSRSVIPTGDFQVEYALTPSGTWRARAFNRTNYDYFNSRNSNKTGIGISYRQEFDKPSDLIVQRKKAQAKRQEKKAEAKGVKKEEIILPPPPITPKDTIPR